MRRRFPGRVWAHRASVAIALLALALVAAAAGKKKGKDSHPPKVQETVGDLAFVVSRGEMKVEGVGLVVGLDNTGVNAPPSWQRKQLVDEMTKAGVEKADKLLESPQVSMVIVRLTIPIGVTPKDRLDAQVELPTGCTTKSLAGGYLLMTRLREVMIAGGSPKGGPEMALAQGPVMIGTPTKPNDPKVGRVLGGGMAKKDYPFTLVIKENRESIRTTKMLETVINERFHQTEDGHQKGAANAKTPSYLELKVPPLYHQNQHHFFRVVQLVQMIETPELRARRIAAWSKELADPTTAGVAAMRLEAIGPAAAEALAGGLKNPNAQVRFFCAEALAYLNDVAGVDALAAAAINQPDFRAYALAALAALDQPAALLKLRKLMDQPNHEVRYGAFNALRTADPRDPFLGLVRVLEAPKRDDDDEASNGPDSMALAIATARHRRRTREDDPFSLYIVDSEGPPLVHVSRTRRAEIVVFGHQQRLLPPIVLGTGAILLNAADNDERIEVSKIVPSRYGDADTKIRTSLDLGDVIRTAANLGASYPDVVAILESAHRQRNLAGELVVDAVPASNRQYLDAVLGKDLTAKRDDAVKRTAGKTTRPGRRWFFGLFDRNRESDPNTTDERTDTSAPAKPGAGAAPGPSSRPGSRNSPADPNSSDSAIKGNTSTNGLPIKRDDSVQ
jgi:flagellar basal body P-ring protein FlgI